jgi:hypothetical protein
VSLKSSFAGVAAAALVVAAPAATAFAGNPGHGHGQSGAHGNHGKSHHHFTANGKVTAVDGDSFTFHAKGGSKALHGTDVTVTVTDATKMRRNGAKATVADLQVGDRVNVNGWRADDDSLTARHVNAHGPAADDSTDATDTSDDSSDAGDTDTSSTDTSGTDTGTTDTSGSDTSGTDTGV